MTFSKIYYETYTYQGKAVQETSHFEFLKWFSLEESRDKLIEAIEKAASEQNKTLLKIDIEYSSGTLYHMFDVTYYYYDASISPQFVFAVAPLLPYIIPAILLIIGAIVATYSLREVKEIIYGPEYAADRFNIIPYIVGIGIIVLAGVYFLKEAPKQIKELRSSVS